MQRARQLQPARQLGQVGYAGRSAFSSSGWSCCIRLVSRRDAPSLTACASIALAECSRDPDGNQGRVAVDASLDVLEWPSICR